MRLTELESNAGLAKLELAQNDSSIIMMTCRLTERNLRNVTLSEQASRPGAARASLEVRRGTVVQRSRLNGNTEMVAAAPGRAADSDGGRRARARRGRGAGPRRPGGLGRPVRVTESRRVRQHVTVLSNTETGGAAAAPGGPGAADSGSDSA